MKKAIIPIGAAAALLTGCSTISTQADQVALHYSGGPIESKEFSGCVDPATRDWAGPADSFYTYPASQRNYVFSPAGDADGPAITFVTSDGIEMTVTGVANFDLNVDCATLQVFHERIGNRYAAYDSDGWNKVLDTYIGIPLDTAVDRAGQEYTYQELYFDPAKKVAWEKAVVASLPELVGRQTDGEEQFFQDWAVTLAKPTPPAEVSAALVQQQAAVAKANAAKAEADAQVAAAQAKIAVERANAAQIAEKIKVLGLDGYLRALALEKGINPYQPTGTPIIQGEKP